MSSNRHLRFKTFVSILIMVIAGPFGNTLLSKGMKSVGAVTVWPVGELARSFAHVFTTPVIWMGVALLLTFFVANILVLSWADYTFVQPASSMSYGMVALMGWTILGEHVSPLRWLGIAVICLGVLIVGRTNPHTTEPGPGQVAAEVAADFTHHNESAEGVISEGEYRRG